MNLFPLSTTVSILLPRKLASCLLIQEVQQVRPLRDIQHRNFFTLQKILFPTIKFDSICAIFNTSPRIIHAILSPKEEQFWIKRYPNILSRINIKPRRPIGLSKGMSANIFQSGKCLIFGACNLKDINAFIRLMKKSIQQMK